LRFQYIVSVGDFMYVQMEDLMNKAIGYALRIGASFAEVKGEDTQTLTIEAINNEIRTVSETHNVGVGIFPFFTEKAVGFPFQIYLTRKVSFVQ